MTGYLPRRGGVQRGSWGGTGLAFRRQEWFCVCVKKEAGLPWRHDPFMVRCPGHVL